MSNFRSYGRNPWPPVVKYLVIVNVVVFIAQVLLDPQIGLTVNYLALHPLDAPDFSPYQVITHMFSHANIGHILFNMFGLWMFGRELENIWGSKRFLNFYLISGIGAAVFHLLVQQVMGTYSIAIGASGAVMGIFAGFAYLFPNTPLMLLFFPVAIKAKWLMIGLIAFDVFGGIRGGDNIAHFAHLGGALTGFIMVWIWNRDKRRFY